MTIDVTICRQLPKRDRRHQVGSRPVLLRRGKMFTVVSLERPHSIAFKCTPETFGELIERPGIIPAPYMARNMWVQEQELGEVLDRRELEALIRTSYELVRGEAARSRSASRRRRKRRVTRIPGRSPSRAEASSAKRKSKTR